MPTEPEPAVRGSKLRMVLDLRIVTVILLVIIAAMLIAWKPWSGAMSDDRTITVTGEATVSAEPDEYQFTPTYHFQASSPTASLDELKQKSEEVVAGLKELGIVDNQIKTTSDGSELALRGTPEGEAIYRLNFAVTVSDKELAQKVQDYLINTSPLGGVAPQAVFSDTKRRELENRARDEAIQDARSKADQSAANLGFRIGKVKEVSDGSGFGAFPATGSTARDLAVAEDTKLSLQPGENKLTYSVAVTYYLR